MYELVDVTKDLYPEVVSDAEWPTTCRMKKCVDPKVRPHHHHYLHTRMTVYPCQCPNIDKPGTKPKD